MDILPVFRGNVEGIKDLAVFVKQSKVLGIIGGYSFLQVGERKIAVSVILHFLIIFLNPFLLILLAGVFRKVSI